MTTNSLPLVPRNKDLSISPDSDMGKMHRAALLVWVNQPDEVIDAKIESLTNAIENSTGVEFDDTRFRNDLSEMVISLYRVKAIRALLVGHDANAANSLTSVSRVFRA